MNKLLIDNELNGLIGPFRKGDLKARDRIFELIRPRIRNFASSIFPSSLNRRASCSDVAQDSLMVIWTKKENFRGSTVEEFWAWAFWIVRSQNKALVEKHFHAQKRTVKNEVAIGGSNAHVFEQPINDTTPSENLQEKENIGEAIQALPPSERIVMALLYLDGCTPHTAAQSLSCSTSELNLTWVSALNRLNRITKDRK